jgi:hypothetical protein
MVRRVGEVGTCSHARLQAITSCRESGTRDGFLPFEGRGLLRQRKIASPSEIGNPAVAAIRPANARRRLAMLLSLPCILVLVLWIRIPAGAQISPGPLSRAHQSLNGTSNCTGCHKLGGGQATFKCLDCHGEIASRIAARTGLHASYNLRAGSSQECVKCHSEHNGEDFFLIKWDIRTFNHQQTGYSLEGKHSGLACNRCGGPAVLSQAPRLATQRRDWDKAWFHGTDDVSGHFCLSAP